VTGYTGTLTNKPGYTTLVEHCIQKGDSNPIRLTPYRLPHVYRETVRRELEEMQTQGIIEPSSSEWAAPIVIKDCCSSHNNTQQTYRQTYFHTANNSHSTKMWNRTSY